MLMTQGRENGSYEQKHQLHRKAALPNSFAAGGLSETVHKFELRRFHGRKSLP